MALMPILESPFPDWPEDRRNRPVGQKEKVRGQTKSS